MTGAALQPRDRGAISPVPGTDPTAHLVDGWEPHRPLGDTLLRRFVFAYASSLAGPVAAAGGHVVQRDRYVVHDLGRPAGFFNGATLLAPLTEAAVVTTLADIERDLTAGGSGQVLLWSVWPTPDLRPAGWELVGHPPILLRSQGEPDPAPPPWVRVEHVTDRARANDWERVAVEGYPLSDLQPWHPDALFGSAQLDEPNLHAWVAYVGDEPAAIGTSYVAHGINVFALGVTLPQHRGRGLWQLLARQRLAAFPQLPALSLFSDASRGPAELLGFVPLQRCTLWARSRP